jgi:hypothetical protein
MEDNMEVSELEKENKELKERLGAWEYDQYVNNLLSGTVFLVIGWGLYFCSLEFAKSIVAHWSSLGLLASTAPWELSTVVLIYLFLVLFGVFKALGNIRDLYWDQFEWIEKNLPIMVSGAWKAIREKKEEEKKE